VVSFRSPKEKTNVQFRMFLLRCIVNYESGLMDRVSAPNLSWINSVLTSLPMGSEPTLKHRTFFCIRVNQIQRKQPRR
jgi:hypothetical protein